MKLFFILLACGLNNRADALPRVNCHRHVQRTTPQGFSYRFEIDGLRIHLAQRVSDGLVPDISDVTIDFEPRRFWPGSYFRLLFGNKPLHLTHADLISAHYDLFARKGAPAYDEILSLRLKYPSDVAGTDYSMRLDLSRDKGTISGEGPNNGWLSARNVLFADPPRDRWLARWRDENARLHGRGTWYLDEP